MSETYTQITGKRFNPIDQDLNLIRKYLVAPMIFMPLLHWKTCHYHS